MLTLQTSASRWSLFGRQFCCTHEETRLPLVNLVVTLTPWFSPHCDVNLDAEGLSAPSVICPLKQMDAVLVTAGFPVQIHLQERIQTLIQTLYSLQAVVIIQDSLFEVQKLLLLDDDAPPPWLPTDCVDVKRASEEWLKAVEEREREQEEEMERLEMEWAELEAELQEFEGRVQILRDEEMRVFVANPNKTQPILDILLKNQTKLIEFLSKFQNDRTEDEQFNDEKTYLIKQIRELRRPGPQDA
ncbi:hypothetical protein MHYP_G00241130 [Metynnis hypsauchen]